MARGGVIAPAAGNHSTCFDRVLALGMNPERLNELGADPKSHGARVGGKERVLARVLARAGAGAPQARQAGLNSDWMPDLGRFLVKKVYQIPSFGLQLHLPSPTLKANRRLKGQTVDIGAWLGGRLLVSKKAPWGKTQRKAFTLCQMLSH